MVDDAVGERGATVDVVVVGSANVDLSIPVDALPGPGETVLGGAVLRGGGGKGANQAVAAARLGARVALVGRVGDDDDGRWLRTGIDADGVDTTALIPTPSAGTGLAVITVDSAGENSIVVSPGANGAVSVDDLDAAAELLSAADVVLAQLEIPIDVVAALRPRCRGRLILNPAPARGGADALDLGDFDVVVPNRSELAVLAGATETVHLSVVADQARSLDTPVVVVTLGAQGAMVVANEAVPGMAEPGVVTVPAMSVGAVDTTAAGDSFCGALAVALVEGADLVEATAWAVRVAGVTVTARGARDSLPRRSAVGSWREVDQSR